MFNSNISKTIETPSTLALEITLSEAERLIFNFYQITSRPSDKKNVSTLLAPDVWSSVEGDWMVITPFPFSKQALPRSNGIWRGEV